MDVVKAPEKIRYLIETVAQPTQYFCGPGDFCSNPNHAQRFYTRSAAESLRTRFVNPENFRTEEHAWTHGSGMQSLVHTGRKP